ncbi:MAG: LLM class F420-dependent oxidoreductase [Rubrobacter sp.]|nr:LLM class F420-dependent oxidoreductase [Rubrobacter sp.]
MKIGLIINNFDWVGDSLDPGVTLAEIARTAEDAGFDSIGVSDHVWQHPFMGGPEAGELECYGTLAYLAAVTSRVKLMSVVSGVHFRYPSMLAKTVTTLDVLSGGRAWLGIGAGHYEEEARGLGIPFPPLKARFEMLEETVQICLRMWDGEQGDGRPFEGRHYRLERPLNVPQSPSRPHPPIMIAGDGEKKTLRLVARYADACNLYPTPEVARKLDVLRGHCEAEGRDYDEIEKTCMFRFVTGEGAPEPDQLVEQLRSLAGLGIQTVIGFIPPVDPVARLEEIGRQVIPAVADL